MPSACAALIIFITLIIIFSENTQVPSVHGWSVRPITAKWCAAAHQHWITLKRTAFFYSTLHGSLASWFNRNLKPCRGCEFETTVCVALLLLHWLRVFSVCLSAVRIGMVVRGLGRVCPRLRPCVSLSVWRARTACNLTVCTPANGYGLDTPGTVRVYWLAGCAAYVGCRHRVGHAVGGQWV